MKKEKILDLLEWFLQNKTFWDCYSYYLPEIPIKDAQEGATYTPPPTAKEFLKFLESEKKSDV